MDPQLTIFIASRGFKSLTAWCIKAGVPVSPLYMARHGRQKLSAKYVARLAKVAGERPSIVLAVLGLTEGAR